ncbi:MAG TPA: hypothetical protein VFV99_34005 [Kofleriaceae bacterium]|nr:hypothetical protein [Kofleriaceae bacterium]
MKRIAVLVVLLLACGKRNDLPEEAWGVADFEREGLHVDKPWTTDDFTQAQAVLERVSKDHRERLPRYRGAKSGAVFAKLVTELPEDATQSIGDKFIAHANRVDALNQISKLYMLNAMAVPPREWIELMGAILREAVVLTQTSEPFLASFGPDDPKRENRLAGLARMKEGYGQMLLGSFLVADDKRVPEADKIALVQYATAALPVLLPASTPDAQSKIREVLAKEQAGVPAGPLHDAIVAANKALP